jgi:hypothetical protein
MPVNVIDIQFFSKKSSKISDLPSYSSHPVVKGVLRFSNKQWVCKTVESESRARYEVLSQEFYRLILNHQPETRIAKTSDGQTYYVLSEEISGFNPLPFDEQANFVNGVYTGLGEVLLVAVFLHEIDLNLNNIGLNHQNQVLKIDGGWSMASVILPEEYFDKPFDITASLIQDLPFVRDYSVHNWLDKIELCDELDADSRIVDTHVSQAAHFRAEINQTILSILILPESYIRSFAQLYLLGKPVEHLVDVFRLRQKELRRAAYADPSFSQYLHTIDAKNWVSCYTNHLKTFTAHQWHPVIQANAHEEFIQAVERQLAELISQADDSRAYQTLNLGSALMSEWNDNSTIVSDSESDLSERHQTAPSPRVSGCLSSLFSLCRSKTSDVVEPISLFCNQM